MQTLRVNKAWRFHGYVPASVVDKAVVATRCSASHQRQQQQRKQHRGKPATASQQPINKTFNNESTTNTEKNNKDILEKGNSELFFLSRVDIAQSVERLPGLTLWESSGGVVDHSLRPRLHQASASTLQPLCNDGPEWVCNPFSSVSTDFNENRIATIIAELSLRWCWRLV